MKDLTDLDFDRLHVMKFVKTERKMRKYLCSCKCGNIKEVFGKYLLNGDTRSCGCIKSETASRQAKSRKGVLHPRYNPNKIRSEREDGRISGTQIWSKSVLQRDNYICQICKVRGGDLVAHHLDGYNWCKEKRLDIDNGVTLCVRCHKTFHTKYGSGNNTKKQFEEFMESR